MYQPCGPIGLFVESTSCVTPFVRWIKDYPILDGLKIPPHVGSYDGKGDPDNYLHLFEGAIRMQKWAMPIACHMFTYTLEDYNRIWWNVQKLGNIVNYEDLKAKFRSHFSQHIKFTKTHLVVHNIKEKEDESTMAFVTRYTDDTLQILGLHEDQSKEVATNGAHNDNKEGFDKFNKSFSWDHNNRKKKNQDMFSPYKGSNHGLLGKFGVEPLRNPSNRESHEGFQTTSSHEERRQRCSGYRSFDSHDSQGKYEFKEKAHSRCFRQNEGITFPLVIGSEPSSDPLPLKYESLAGKSLRVDSKTLLVALSGEHSWPIGEVPLEITIGDSPFTKTETLNFVIVRSDSPYNLLLGRTTMQQTGMVISTIHTIVKFHTPHGVGTIFFSYESSKFVEGHNKIKETACKEVDELTKAGILREVKYQTWVAYPVMVKKSDGDAYKGYLHIQMAEGDEDKTTFFTEKGVFCYRKTPFGLKNAGATYQRLVDKVFSSQIGRNLEAYVDDMVIKNASKEDMLLDIQETFARL
ncbi:reverse transcriptase domain-containing protein [Tanacetum coccineum]